LVVVPLVTVMGSLFSGEEVGKGKVIDGEAQACYDRAIIPSHVVSVQERIMAIATQDVTLERDAPVRTLDRAPGEESHALAGNGHAWAEADRLYTADDLLEISARDENRYELIQGRLRVMAPAGDVHGDMAMGLGGWMRVYADQNNLGKVFAAETGFVLAQDPYTVRAPDVAFVTKERLSLGMTGKYFPAAPDLAVEVVSPNDTAAEVQDKVQDWLRHGVRLVWVVEPKTRTVTIFRPDGSANVLQATDTLSGEEVLAGFEFGLGRLFEE
jgi:Uma2 family endonuclease